MRTRSHPTPFELSEMRSADTVRQATRRAARAAFRNDANPAIRRAVHLAECGFGVDSIIATGVLPSMARRLVTGD